MLTLEAWCYLAILGATFGVYAAGRGERGAFRIARRGALVALAAVLILVETRLILLGHVTDARGLAGGAVALAGVFILLGIDLVRSDLETALESVGSSRA